MDEVKNIKKYSFIPIESCNMCNSKDIETLGIRLNQSQGRAPKTKTGISVSVQRCRDCDLVFSNPQPIPNKIDDHYNIDPNTYWNEAYFTINENHYKEEIKKIQKLLPFEKGQKVLDIGAGLGKTMIAFENLGYEVTGLEPSKSFYQMAIDKMKIDPKKLVNQSLEEVHFEDNSFDIITFGAVLEHLYDPNLALKNATKWLKPGGIIIGEIPNSRWLISILFNWYYHIIGTNYVTNISPMHAPFHLYEFSQKSFEKNGRINGYQVANTEFEVGTIGLPKIVEKILNPIMKWTNRELVMTVYLKK